MWTTHANTSTRCNVPKMHYTTPNNNDSIISSSNPQLLSAKKKPSTLEMTPKRDIFQINKNEATSGTKLQNTPRNNALQCIRTSQANNSDMILREKNMNVNEATPKKEVQVAAKKVLAGEKELKCKPIAAKLEMPDKQNATGHPKNEGKAPSAAQNKQIVPYTAPAPTPAVPVPATPLPELTTFKMLKIRGKDYIMINKLGEGGSGEVYRCLEQDTLLDRAVKVVNLAVDANTAASYINEVKMLKDLQGSDRVIKMYDFEQQNQNLFVVMEKGDVDFSAFLRNITTESQLQRHIIICYWIEMLKCVQEIHKNGIIHSDLKPSNFLLVGGRLKLIDFGIASKISGDMTSVIKNEQVGTFNYISPESLLDSRESPTEGKPRIRISYKSDVWSLGCILYQMVYRKTPFHNYTSWMTKIVTIIDKNHRIEYPPVEGIPPQLIEMIKKCLTYDMKSRSSVDELLNMYYMGNY